MNGPVIGIVYPEHVVPAGALVLSLRYCSNCGKSFLSAGDRGCRACHAEPIQPPIERATTIAILEELMRGEEPIAQ